MDLIINKKNLTWKQIYLFCDIVVIFMSAEVSKHKILSHPKYVRSLRYYLFKVLHESEVEMTHILDLQMAFTEALNNVIQHAYKDRYELPIIIELYLYPDKIEIIIEDFGVQVPRSQICSRPLDDFREGGLGVFLIEKLTDYLHYDTEREKGTKLTLVKNM